MGSVREIIAACMRDPLLFCEHASELKLRRYQEGVASAICQSVTKGLGLSLVVMFPRQSGKNELQAQIEAYLLVLFSEEGADLVKISPTWKPQSQNAMRRLERVLRRNVISRLVGWEKQEGYQFTMGLSRITFLSGSPGANIVGATASTLLEVDEAQDIEIDKYDKEIAPMAASTNATRVFWGTAWTGQTLLAREYRLALKAQEQDGLQRAWRIGADDVAAEVPAYAAFVAGQVARLGRTHPMVRTQFYSEEIAGAGSLFNTERIAMVQGDHPAQVSPTRGRLYAMLLDVAGEDEFEDASQEDRGKRDSTALTIVEIDLEATGGLLAGRPTYRVVNRRLWTGVKHARLYAELVALARLWDARTLVVDASGVGAGLASFLGAALPGRVQPFIFSQPSKSRLGWDWLSIIDSGRWKEHGGHTLLPRPSPHPPGEGRSGEAEGATSQALQALFYRQLELCRYEILPGPEKTLRWSVPDGTRDPCTGELMHDDLVMSAALAAVLDGQNWQISGPAAVVERGDPLEEMENEF